MLVLDLPSLATPPRSSQYLSERIRAWVVEVLTMNRPNQSVPTIWRTPRGLLTALLWCLCLQAPLAQAEEFCRPLHYADGDTFSYRNTQGREIRVRVAGFDAPERGQPFSQVAKERLRQLTSQGANCDCYKQDRYGRSVCTVRTPGGENVATAMLAAGLGCIDARFEPEANAADRQAARAALAQAQRDKRGMWGHAQPICAYDYRRMHPK